MHKTTITAHLYQAVKMSLLLMLFLTAFAMLSNKHIGFEIGHLDLLTATQTGLVMSLLMFRYALAQQLSKQMDSKRFSTPTIHHAMRFSGIYIVALGAAQHDNIMYVMGLSLLVIEVMIWQLIQTKTMVKDHRGHLQTQSFERSGRASIMLNVNYASILMLSLLWLLNVLTKGFSYELGIFEPDKTIDVMMLLCIFITFINLAILNYMVTLHRISCADLD